jgi:hypothetical protein
MQAGNRIHKSIAHSYLAYLLIILQQIAWGNMSKSQRITYVYAYSIWWSFLFSYIYCMQYAETSPQEETLHARPGFPLAAAKKTFNKARWNPQTEVLLDLCLHVHRSYRKRAYIEATYSTRCGEYMSNNDSCLMSIRMQCFPNMAVIAIKF